MSPIQMPSSDFSNFPPPYDGKQIDFTLLPGQNSTPIVITGEPQSGGVLYCPRVDRNPKLHGELRIPAIGLSIVACCCGNWILAGPALLLAFLPDYILSGNPRAMHISSIVLAILAIITATAALIAFLVVLKSSYLDSNYHVEFRGHSTI